MHPISCFDACYNTNLRDVVEVRYFSSWLCGHRTSRSYDGHFGGPITNLSEQSSQTPCPIALYEENDGMKLLIQPANSAVIATPGTPEQGLVSSPHHPNSFCSCIMVT